MFVALSADPFLTGPFAGAGGPQAQVAEFGGPAAGDAERRGERGPAHLLLAGRGDQFGFPAGQFLPQPAQRGECRDEVAGASRARAGLVQHAADQAECPGGAEPTAASSTMSSFQ
ncbi:hypothetical protein F9C11_26630 [Amycolatopsis sp. VS8301801F10]|uniref:hypothetical protein n=1 Tax=Amycolatopsis sp. VS8301801F10 TaxID=2652442 RepID=UPI0038FCBC73